MANKKTPCSCMFHESGVQLYHTARYFAESFAVTNDEVEKLWNIAETEEEKQELKRLWFVRNPYEAKAGRLSFAERKVNFESIEKSFDVLEERFMKEIADISEKAKEEFLLELRKAIDEKDFARLEKIRFGKSGELSKAYAAMMKNFFEIGKKTASDEMQVQVPATDKDISGLYRAQALQIEKKIYDEVGNVAKEEALLWLAQKLEASLLYTKIEKALAQKLQKITNASATPAIWGAFNTWRLTVFELHPEKIYGFQYTAVLDRKTTNLCMSLNGRVIAKDDQDFYRLQPPNHPRCRSFWVEIMTDEFLKPKISKIPESIDRTKTGYNTFQDLQKVKVYKPELARGEKQKKEEVVDNVIATIRARLQK